MSDRDRETALTALRDEMYSYSHASRADEATKLVRDWADRIDALLKAGASPSWDGWLPTPANVNALPEPLRHYIHQLETNCDPAGDQQRLILTLDENAMLRAQIAELTERLLAHSTRRPPEQP